MQSLLSVLLFVLPLCYSYGQTNTDFTPSFKVSEETTHKIPDGQAYTFGYLEVLENRKSANEKTIKVPVYIFKSRNSKPAKDPIVYTVGGPGSTTMPSAQYMNYYKYLDDRDFILIEQRGNYYAKPHLDCPEWSKAVYQSRLPDFKPLENDRLFENAAQSCKERFIEKGIDLNAYNTNEIAADIYDLVQVLGLKEYNLLTMSYSTKIAQVLMRDYPEGIRSVVMDSPLPLEVSYDEESVGNLLKAVESLLSDCESEEACGKAYPNIKQRFFEYLKEKTTTPLLVNFENPNSGKPEVFYLKGEDLITVFTAASTSDVSNIPFEINKLLNNDLSSLKKQLSYLFKEPGSGAGIGMRLSVWCAEEYPFNQQAVIKRETSSYPEVVGLSPATYDASICNIWGVEKVPDLENEAIKSDIPVLFINGEYDELTPVKWATKMKENFSNSYQLVFKGWKHTPTTNWGNQCAMIAANEFFKQPNQRPNPICFANLVSPKYKTE